MVDTYDVFYDEWKDVALLMLSSLPIAGATEEKRMTMVKAT